MGYSKVISSNITLGVQEVYENVIESRLSYRLLLPKKVKNILLANTSQLGEKTINYNVIQRGYKRHELRVENIVEQNFLAGTTKISNFGFDSDGNVNSIFHNLNNIEIIQKNIVFDRIGSHVKSKPTIEVNTITRTGEIPYTTTTKNTFKPNGLPESETQFYGLPNSITTTYGYNTLNNPVSVTTSVAGLPSVINTAQFDVKGRFAVQKTNPLNQTGTFNYNHWGSVLSSREINALTTSYEYDGFNRLKKTNYPTGYSELMSYHWDIDANKVYYTFNQHPGSSDTKAWYDKLNRELIKESEAFGGGWITTNTDYDSRGNVFSSSQPHKTGETYLTNVNTYDDHNRIWKTTNALGVTTVQYSHSGGNLTVQITDQANRVTSKTQDATGKTIAAHDQGGNLEYTYFSHGKPKAVLNNGIQNVSFGYDPYLNQTQINDVNGGVFNRWYDGFGRLQSETNPKFDATTYTYDILNRITQRTEEDGTLITDYVYLPQGAGINQLDFVIDSKGNVEQYSYDNFGRLSQKTYDLPDGAHFEELTAYNIYGQTISEKFPSGFELKYEYDRNGFAQKISDGTGLNKIYECLSKNGINQVTSSKRGGSLISNTAYLYGLPILMNTPNVQNLALLWNWGTGNLMMRGDGINNLREDFTYDNLDRLTSATVFGQHPINTIYHTNGNIEYKSDAGSYAYNSSKLNAVTRINGPNPNIPVMAQDIVFNSFDQPEKISEGDYTIYLEYGTDHQRIKTTLENNGNTEYTRYFLGQYELQKTGGQDRHLHYISTPEGIAATVEIVNGVTSYNYVFTDHLGSILKVTDAQGTAIAEQNFDAWGRYRNPLDWTYNNVPAVPKWMYRGYTGHEHLPEVGLINMNGRLYDPVVGRMLSPDNFIQLPEYSQNYNRYSYVLNNPLKFNDPSGEVIPAIVYAGIVAMGAMNVMYQAWNSPNGLSTMDAANHFAIGVFGGALTYASGGTLAATVGGMMITQGASSHYNMQVHGRGNINTVLLDMAVAGATSYVGGVVSNYLLKMAYQFNVQGVVVGASHWVDRMYLNGAVQGAIMEMKFLRYYIMETVRMPAAMVTHTMVNETVKNGIKFVPNPGGRIGNATTQNQIANIATQLEGRGYTITHGGGRFSEEYLKPLNPGSGGSFPDITAIHPKYGTLRINTVDITARNLPTTRELTNAVRIRTQIAPGEHLLLINK
jgi:RHS repeat-associated protein